MAIELPTITFRRPMADPTYLGIDVSKGYADFCLLTPDGDTWKTAVLDDTARGHEDLTQLIDDALEEFDRLEVGLEATGGYERNWLKTLQKLGDSRPMATDLINALAVKRFAEQDLHGNKTDEISAQLLADYMRRGYRKMEVEFEPHLEGPKAVIRMVRETVKRRASLKSRFRMLLFRANPELVPYSRSRLSKWLLKLVARYPTARQLAAVQPEEITDIPYLTEQKARDILTAARESVASQEDERTGFALAHMAEKLLDLNEEIRMLKDRVWEMVKDDQGVQVLRTIPGIERWSAAILRSEIGPIDQFDSAKEVVAYAGLDPQYEESGDKQASRSISKRGNPRIRAILYVCARNAVQHNPPVKALYDRLTKRGKHHMLAMTACMRKLLCIAYGCWSSGEPFDPNYEKRLKQRKAQKNDTDEQTPDDDRGRPTDLRAPVSRTEAQRRREVAMPQKGVDP